MMSFEPSARIGEPKVQVREPKVRVSENRFALFRIML